MIDGRRRRSVVLGGVFGKALRDSRGAVAIVSGCTAGLLLAAPVAFGIAYPTPESRTDLGRPMIELGPVTRILAGPAVNIDTMGGHVQWQFGRLLILIMGLWSVLAMSGALAGEARRGSLDLVAATPLGRRRIAVEKIAGHVVGVVLASIIAGAAVWLAGSVAAPLPGDRLGPAAGFGLALWLALTALAHGGLAFALAAFFGRAVAAWSAGAVLIAGPLLAHYRTLARGVAWLADGTPTAWTVDHLPLAGRYDWLSLVPVAVSAVALFTLGVEAFERRDLGAVRTIRWTRLFRLPSAARGLRGPVGRSYAERLPGAVAWGSGIGVIVFAVGAGSGSPVRRIAGSPELGRGLRAVFPGLDLATTGGFLDLTIRLLYVVAGLAAVALVAGWAGEEGSGRLETVLCVPLRRWDWVLRSGLGVLAAIGTMTALVVAAIGGGVLVAGDSPVAPMLGTIMLGLYAAALAGVGIAVGGGVRGSLAVPATAVVVAVTALLDLFAPLLRAPDWVRGLAVTAHLGQPVVGRWDAVGIVACLLLAAGGLAVGGFGFARRDLNPKTPG